MRPRNLQKSFCVMIHDLGLAGLVGVGGHVAKWWVIEVLDEAIVARRVELVELFAEELVGVSLCGQEVEAVWWICTSREIWQWLILVGDVRSR